MKYSMFRERTETISLQIILSPSISQGHCDVGKQYCCQGRKVGPPPSRPVHSSQNGILVGPGGPIDAPNRPQQSKYPIRETYDGSPYGGHNGVLVGPGGPAGNLNRPIDGTDEIWKWLKFVRLFLFKQDMVFRIMASSWDPAVRTTVLITDMADPRRKIKNSCLIIVVVITIFNLLP